LGVLGIVLILAGLAFRLIESTSALFAGTVCFIVTSAVEVKAFFRKAG